MTVLVLIVMRTAGGDETENKIAFQPNAEHPGMRVAKKYMASEWPYISLRVGLFVVFSYDRMTRFFLIL